MAGGEASQRSTSPLARGSGPKRRPRLTSSAPTTASRPTATSSVTARRSGRRASRSEERRVGKECRSLCDWSSDVCSSDLWTKAKTEVNVKRAHDSKPAYRDLKRDGKTIWAACICDAVNANPAKALVKLGIKGNHDTSWRTQAGVGAFGESVVKYNGKLYLGAGGSDFVGQYDKARGGSRDWVRDTSGSTQVVALVDGK